MKLPNKMFSYEESMLPKFPIILDNLAQGDKSVRLLYRDLSKQFEDIGEFIMVLECLFALGKLDINKETRNLHYVA